MVTCWCLLRPQHVEVLVLNAWFHPLKLKHNVKYISLQYQYCDRAFSQTPIFLASQNNTKIPIHIVFTHHKIRSNFQFYSVPNNTKIPILLGTNLFTPRDDSSHHCSSDREVKTRNPDRVATPHLLRNTSQLGHRFARMTHPRVAWPGQRPRGYK